MCRKLRSGQAMAALYTRDGGWITDQVWTLREVLLFRVPPWRSAGTVSGNMGEGSWVERAGYARKREGASPALGPRLARS